MNVFGPKYPAPLQRVVTHAERFSALLGRLGVNAPELGGFAWAWWAGRKGELEVVVEMNLFDWASGRVDIGEVTARLASYLEDLHAGARRHFDLGVTLECCEDEVFLTVPNDSPIVARGVLEARKRTAREELAPVPSGEDSSAPTLGVLAAAPGLP